MLNKCCGFSTCRNINTVEEFIKDSLFFETTSTKSLYRSLRLDPDTVDIKRIRDENLVKAASLARDIVSFMFYYPHNVTNI